MTDDSGSDCPRRRRILATLAGGIGVSLAGCSGGQSSPTPSSTSEPTASPTDAGEVQVVDAVNHLLQPGEGPATPGEYALPNTVAESVVDSVAGFVNGL